MGNCLKTQLKESVNNNGLPVLNSIRIKANAGNYVNETLALLFNDPASVEGLNGANIFVNGSNVGNEYQIVANESRAFYPQNEGGNYLIKNKYALQVFSSTKGAGLLEFDLTDFACLTVLSSFSSVNDIIHGDLKNFKNTALTNFTLNKATHVTGSFEHLPISITNLTLSNIDKAFSTSELSHLINIVVANLANININGFDGNITDFGNMKAIEVLSIGSTTIKGNIEDFIRIQRSGDNPRLTCNRISMSWAGGVGRRLKFNNVEIAAAADTYIHWDNTKMYLNQGGIDVAEVAF